MEKFLVCDFIEPIGRLMVFMTDEAIARIHFGGVNTQCEPAECDRFGFIRQMNEYLAGERKDFDLPISLERVTSEFSRRVLENMMNIPYGQTLSYSELATISGNAKAARAVGMSCNRNPLAILIPCHRVVGKNGSLTGYAGGLECKRFLQELERKNKHKFISPDYCS